MNTSLHTNTTNIQYSICDLYLGLSAPVSASIPASASASARINASPLLLPLSLSLSLLLPHFSLTFRNDPLRLCPRVRSTDP